MNYYKLILIFVAVLIQACQLTNTSYPSQWDLKPDNNQAIISRLEIAKSLGFDANGCYTKNPLYASQVRYLRDRGVTERKTYNCLRIAEEEKRRVTELKIKILKRQEKIRKEEIKSTSAKMFSKERKTCATLGFKVGTPKHAECVLKLIEQ